MSTAIPSSQVLDVEGNLRQIHQGLLQLEKAVLEEPQFARLHGREIAQARTQYTDLASKYQGFRALVGLDPVAGLSGLGVLPAVIWASVVAAGQLALIVAGAAGLLTVVLKLLGVLQEYFRTEAARSQAQEQAALQIGTLEQQRQAALARGDIEEARRLEELIAQLQAGGQPQDPFSWFQQNWGWLALTAAGIVIVPRLLD